ncbi:MAG: ribosome biogenesis GTPase Der, partial [Planctomycetales bacterium]
LTYLMEADERYFELVDTGGLGFDDPDNLTGQVDGQIQFAIDSASLVLFVVDAHDGRTADDWEVLQRVRRSETRAILVVNKTDSEKWDALAGEFHEFGVTPLVRVSAQANRGRDELLEAIAEHLPESSEDDQVAEPEMKLTVVGRRNVGKSTFINSLLKTDRMIVSEIPGTTRDSVDVRFEMDEHSYIAIDTPGLRKRKSMQTNVDHFGLHRAQRSIRRADVVFLFFDASQEIGRVEKQLADYISEQYKPCVFVVNKWDLYAGQVATEEWADYLRAEFPTAWHAPIAFITGQTGKNVKTLVNHGQMLFKQARTRVPTAELNKLIRAALNRTPPPMYRHRKPKIFYAAQVGDAPPTIVFVCNYPDAFQATYRRYLLSVLHDQLDFGESPIKIHFRQRRGGERTSSSSESAPESA